MAFANTKYERFKANRQQVDDALVALADALCERGGGPHYAIGYLTSIVAHHVAKQGKAQRESFLSTVQYFIESK